jgi:hypothetical protein
MEIRTKNLNADVTTISFNAGEEMIFTAEIINAAFPFLAVFVPNGRMDEKMEVFG